MDAQQDGGEQDQRSQAQSEEVPPRTGVEEVQIAYDYCKRALA